MRAEPQRTKPCASATTCATHRPKRTYLFMYRYQYFLLILVFVCCSVSLYQVIIHMLHSLTCLPACVPLDLHPAKSSIHPHNNAHMIQLSFFLYICNEFVTDWIEHWMHKAHCAALKHESYLKEPHGLTC